MDGSPLFSFADYNRANKLPYTMNQTLDIQWQPRNDVAVTVGYVGNFGRHEIIPIPFNQAGIASPTHPINGQNYTASFDIPINDVSQNLEFNDFPTYGQPLYASPTASGLGITNKTIGSARQVQMS